MSFKRPPVYIGRLQNPNNRETDFIYGGERSLITIAPPESGKTWANVIPTLLMYDAPAVVLDIVGNCYKNTSKRRAEFGRVIRFAPFDPEESEKYNPLEFIRADERYLWADTRKLVDMLIVPESGKKSTWEQRGKMLLTAMIAYLVKDERERKGKAPNMQDVLDLLQGSDEYLTGFFLEICKSDIAPLRRAGDTFGSMHHGAPKQFLGVKDGAIEHLQVWEGYSLSQVTQECTWTPEEFKGDSKPTLFIEIPFDQIEEYSAVLRTIIAQHFNILTTQPLARQSVLFILDEFPQLGYMKAIEQGIEVGRNAGLRFWLFAQNIGQIKTRYQNWDGLIDLMGVEIYMNQKKEEAAKIAKRLGKKKGLLDGKERPMVEAQDLETGAYADFQIVFSQNQPPCKVRKIPAYSDESEFKPLLGSIDD